MRDYIVSEIGGRIKEVRLEKNLKVFEVADRAGVSNGLISRIENGRTIPSLPVLISIVRALEVKMDDFFADFSYEPKKKYIHKKADETKVLAKEDESIGFHYNLILSENISCDSLESVILDIEPNSKRNLVSTDAYEYKYMLEGELEYQIEDEIIHLKKGDSLLYDGRLMHVPHNRSSQRARMLAIYLFKNN